MFQILFNTKWFLSHTQIFAIHMSEKRMCWYISNILFFFCFVLFCHKLLHTSTFHLWTFLTHPCTQTQKHISMLIQANNLTAFSMARNEIVKTCYWMVNTKRDLEWMFCCMSTKLSILISFLGFFAICFLENGNCSFYFI